MVNRPHPLFAFVAGAVVLAIVVAAFAKAREPAWALQSEWVYRAELGAAVLLLVYLPLVALLLAWRGETFRRIQAPGGAGIETPADEINTAAEEFARYRQQAENRFAELERAVDNLNRRVERLEA